MDSLVEQYVRKGQSGHLNEQECVEIIIKLSKHYPLTTIIVDALDECEKLVRGRLLNDLEKIVQRSESLVKVFVSSRNEPDIEYKLKRYPQIWIGTGDNAQDIKRFVHEQVAEDIREGRLLGGSVKKELQDYIVDTLISGAKGM
jgi:hypothetical protein